MTSLFRGPFSERGGRWQGAKPFRITFTQGSVRRNIYSGILDLNSVITKISFLRIPEYNITTKEDAMRHLH
eukprot:3853638-Pyramimonas_sp.AAC.1